MECIWHWEQKIKFKFKKLNKWFKMLAKLEAVVTFCITFYTTLNFVSLLVLLPL